MILWRNWTSFIFTMCIAEMAEPRIGAVHVEKLMAHYLKFDPASERGARRDDIRPELRVIGYRRSVTIAFTLSDTQVVILRVFYGGVDWKPLLA